MDRLLIIRKYTKMQNDFMSKKINKDLCYEREKTGMHNIKCFLITVFIIAIYSINVHAADPMLKWDASTGDVSGYTIYYGLSQGNYPFNEDVGKVTQYSLSNFSLNEGTTYYFVVRAYNASGESGNSNVTTYFVPDAGDTTPPSPPQGVAGEIVNNDIVLTWQANSEADFSFYRIYYGTLSRVYGSPIPVNGTEYSITGLNTNITYYLAVSAVDTSGNESGYSSPEASQTIGGSGSDEVEVRIASGNDDAEQRENGTIYFNSSDIELVDEGDTENQTVGLRFNGIQIPQGATITNAYIEFETDETSSGSASLQITAQNIDNAPAFANVTRNISNRAVVSANVAWNDVSVWNVINGKHQTPNLSPVIQSVINRNGWVSGNAMVFIITGTGKRTAESYEGERQAAPLLHVEYGFGQQVNQAPVVEAGENQTVDLGEAVVLDAIVTDDGSPNDTLTINWSQVEGVGTAIFTDSSSVDTTVSADTAGDYVFQLAVDDGEHSTTDTLTVTYTEVDTTAPVVTITSPTAGTTHGVETSSLNISGTASDAEGVTQVAWSNSRGGSGTASGTNSWSATGITLGEGENLITVTVSDEAGNKSYDSLTVVYTKPVVTDRQSPVLNLKKPTTRTFYFTRKAAIKLSGTASDNVGIKEIKWKISQGGNGVANGTSSWEALNVPLSRRWNNITITAEDTAGNKTFYNLTVFSWR